MFSDEDIIFKYTKQDAVNDGVIIELGQYGKLPVYVTRNCFDTVGLKDPVICRGIVLEAIDALSKPDPEDDDYRSMRVIHKEDADCDSIWVIHDGEGITIMFPEDY